MNNPFSMERDASMETLHQNANHLKSVSLDWDEVFSPDPLPEPETDPRTIFRECLGEVAAAAKAKLPGSEGRNAKAVAILINDDCVARLPSLPFPFFYLDLAVFQGPFSI